MTDAVKCNCTVCGSRFRSVLDRAGNLSTYPKYCSYCRSLLEETDPSGPEVY